MPALNESELLPRLRQITTVILDVDGVLTDGGILIARDGSEMKQFNVHDGSGIRFLKREGIEVAIISGRNVPAVNSRAQELGITEVYQGYNWKLDAFTALTAKLKLSNEQICCLGDDVHDIPLMQRVGVAVAVQNARPEAKQAAHYVTQASGGNGAIREVVELILRAQGKWDSILKRYMES
jgi:3-deoxy-D-manno-octulosonate 8-phosphate phosphatase (KDO 8-P phosphatase)